MKRSVSKITAILHPDRAMDVIRALQKEGIRQLDREAGRSPVLEEVKGLSALLSASGSRLASDPVEIVSFLVEPACEDALIGLIADKGRLHVPGMGSVYSEAVDVIEAHPLLPVNQPRIGAWPKPENLYSELIGISCTVVRGEADRIARAVLLSGACVPTVTFGIGTGVRDKLGLLRITLPAEKEVLTSVMSRFDAATAMDLMIEAGRLEQIGRGIVYVFPVKQGIINTRITRGASGHAATMEQIITAVDGLKGGMEWRRMGAETEPAKRFFIEGNLNLSIACDEGRGAELVQAAMCAGAAGATISRCKSVRPEQAATVYEGVSPAREVCNLVVNPDNLDRLVAALREAGALDEETHGLITTHPVPRAFRGTA